MAVVCLAIKEGSLPTRCLQPSVPGELALLRVLPQLAGLLPARRGGGDTLHPQLEYEM